MRKNMKAIKIYIVAITGLVLIAGCNDDFMDRLPETSIAPEAFFNSVKDLELYTNTYYSNISIEFFDYVSDNCLSYAEAHENNNLIRGTVIPGTVGGWDKGQWGTLRKYNLFLANVHKAEGEASAINHYIGTTRLMRATWYYSMVKKYNDVPWYSTPLTDIDEDLLYKARDPRTLVVDSILADLDFAIRNMSENMGNRTQFSRWYAAAMMARICLHEGTFRKYHDELNLQSTANTYLQKAVEAAEIIMNSGNFAIDKSGAAENAYHALFANYDLSKSPEMILIKDYDLNSSITHFAGRRTFDWVTGYSRSLMESYQYITPDGKAVPFSTVAGYDRKNFVEVFENRDLRFKQTFMYPGFTLFDDALPYRPVLNRGGYPSIKYMPATSIEYQNQTQYTDVPVARYAEILLIYAEAKAELGTLTQDDLDRSINQIRSRVDLPPTVIDQMIEDPTLKAQFPGISNYILLDIRRERRIELVIEHFRWDDLMRWKAGHLVEKVQEGIYVDKFGVFDVTGDGIPEVGIFESEATNTIPEADRGNYSFYYLKNAAGALNTFSLSNGNSGYIVLNGELSNRSFKQPQYYYWPIPQTQLLLNPSLKQTIFWE
jgi:hypothetical protein